MTGSDEYNFNFCIYKSSFK